MRAVPFCTGTLCNILHIVFSLANEIDIVFDGTSDEFRSSSFARLGYKVLIFKAVLCFGKIPNEFCNQFFLLFCNRPVFPCVIDFLYALALSNILDEVF